MSSETAGIAAAPVLRLARWRISDARLGAVLLVAALAVGAVLRLWVGFNDDGIYWPDEIFQSLEPAHRLVWGYGLLPWEYVEGARSWAFPGLIAGVLKLCQVTGLDAPAQYLAVVRTVFCALGVLTAFGCWRLARSLGASAPAAAAGATLFALSAPLIYFAPRALSETASAAPIVFAFALALRPGAGRRAVAVAASLLGLAVLLRLQNGVFCVGLLAILAGQRRWTHVRDAFAVLTLWAGLFGALDWLTWGRPFHSALTYLKFNLVEGKASFYGVAPPTYYLRVLFTAMPLTAACLVVLGRFGFARARGLALVAIAAFLLLWLIPHKEFRFLAPVLPLFCALAGVGVDGAGRRLSEAWGVRTVALGVCAVALISGLGVGRLTFNDLGQITKHRPTHARAMDDGGGMNRLMMKAGEQPDLCGLHVAAHDVVWTGGQSRTDHRAPIFTEGDPLTGGYNYAVAPSDPTLQRRGLDGVMIASDDGFALIRLSRPTCQPWAQGKRR